MLLGGYSRCALGDLPRSLVLRPKTAESGRSQKTASEFSSCSSNARCDKSAPRVRAEWPDARMPGTQDRYQFMSMPC